MQDIGLVRQQIQFFGGGWELFFRIHKDLCSWLWSTAEKPQCLSLLLLLTVLKREKKIP